jgi:hypothetical protein
MPIADAKLAHGRRELNRIGHHVRQVARRVGMCIQIKEHGAWNVRGIILFATIARLAVPLHGRQIPARIHRQDIGAIQPLMQPWV